MLKPTLFKKFFGTFFVILVLGAFALIVYGRYQFKDFFFQERSLNLQNLSFSIKGKINKLLKEENPEVLSNYIKQISLKSKQRISVILPSGNVLADSNKEPRLLDNHQNRPEVSVALSGHVGKSIRYSESLSEESIYLAIPLYNSSGIVHAVLRHSYIIHDLQPALWAFTWKLSLGSLLLVAILALFSGLTSRKIGIQLKRIQSKAKEFAEGNFYTPIGNYSGDVFEISSLVRSLNSMATKLGKTFDKITRQENEREAVFSGMSEGVLSVYINDEILHWNRAVCKFFDVEYTDDYKKRPVLEVFRSKIITDFILAVKNKKSIVEKEIELFNGNIFLVHGNMLYHSDGNELGVLMVFSDITKMRKLESHRKEFVANVSHELRTPLTSIEGYVENLLDGSFDIPETAMSFLNTIKRNASRLTQITEDLLFLSEVDLEEKNGLSDVQKIDLAGFVKSVCDKYIDSMNDSKKSLVIFNNFILKTNFSDKDDEKDNLKERIFVNINSRLMDHALSNLIENAIKFSDQSEKIEVNLKLSNALNNHSKTSKKVVLISVVDKGVGIHKNDLDRIFERFYSADKARSRELGGSGLGLSIVKNIVAAHGGKLSVESTLGQGSTFTIELSSC